MLSGLMLEAVVTVESAICLFCSEDFVGVTGEEVVLEVGLFVAWENQAGIEKILGENG
jgi:hypothetical protein